jgi:hypothetical protein
MEDKKPKKDEKTGQFVAGNGGNGGRHKGARNRLHAAFVTSALEHYEREGKAAWDIIFRESPGTYLKIITAVLPKEYTIEDARFKDMGDEELAEHLARIERIEQLIKETQRGEGNAEGGAKTTLQ